jgi:hypothetical protein
MILVKCGSYFKAEPLTFSRMHGVSGNLHPSYHLLQPLFHREEFVAPIPDPERGDLISAYHKRLNSDDVTVRLTAAKAWVRWE